MASGSSWRFAFVTLLGVAAIAACETDLPELGRLAGGGGGAAFALVEEDGRLVVLDDGRPVLAYNHEMQAPPDVSDEYRRSSYVHPIWDPSGRIVTDDFPADHPHHRGLSWMWPRVFVGDEAHDQWHLRGIRHRFDSWLVREAAADGATIGVRNGWHLDDRKVVDEEVHLRIHPLRNGSRDIDVTLRFEALERVEVSGQPGEQRGYGGLVLRLAPRTDPRITTGDGIQEGDSDRVPSPWADQSGRFGDDDAFSGVALFQHPENPDFPAGWTLRHYGFVGVAWPGLERAVLEPGLPLVLRFRVCVHDGDAVTAGVAGAYAAYAAAEEQ
jgi:hypothetical protein